MSAYEWSIRYNSTDLGGSDYNLLVVSRDHPYLPQPILHVEQLAGADGAAVQGTNWGPRHFNFTCMVAAANAAQRETRVTNIASILSVAQEGEKALVLGWKPALQWAVRLTTELRVDIMMTGAEFELGFMAPNPASAAYP